MASLRQASDVRKQVEETAYVGLTREALSLWRPVFGVGEWIKGFATARDGEMHQVK